jgi:hypothetical protein
MKYTVEINLPINKVIELFFDKAHFKEWKKYFLSHEHVSGIPNEVGSADKLVFKSVTLIETVTSKNLPAEISYEYEHKRGTKTIMIHKATNRFTSLQENKTLYEQDSEMVKVFGLLPKIIMGLMKGAGNKYAQDQLNQFKVFAEKQNSKP